VSFAVAGLVEGDPSFPVAPSGDHRDFPFRSQVSAKRIGVIPFVGDDVARSFRPVQQQLSGLYVGDVAGCQVEGVGPPKRVGQGMDFGCLATAREPDRLILRPFLPP